MHSLAEAITKIFNPLTSLLATLILAISVQQIPVGQKIFWLAFTLIAIVPVAAVFYTDYKGGKLSSFWSPSGAERKKTFLSWTLSTAIYTGLAFWLAAPRLIIALGLVLTLLGATNWLFAKNNLKLSIHAELATLFALVAVLAGSANLIFLALLIPLVAWARISLKAHDLSEISLGVLLVVISVSVIFSFFGLATF